MDFALLQPPIWTNVRTPWEVAYLKSYLEQLGLEGRTYDLSLAAMPLLQEFVSEVHQAMGNTFQSEVFTSSVNFLTSASEAVLIRLLYGEGTEEARRATAALLSLRTACEPEVAERAAAAFLDSPFYPRVFEQLAAECRKVVAERPRVVGAMTHITTLGFAAYALSVVKALDPSIRTVLSAYQVSMAPEAALERLPWVDFVTVGENEVPYRDILLLDPAPRRVVRPSEVLDLDRLPPADYSDLDMSRYKWISIRAGRNCPFRCSFCQENAYWGRFRTPSIDHVLNEIEIQKSRHPQTHFDFVDLEMTSYADTIARSLVDRGIDVTWSGWMRPARRNLEYISLLKESGCEFLTFGVESGSKKVLARMNRLPQGAPEEIAADLEVCRDNEIRTGLTAIAGFPGETREDWEMTLDFFREHTPVIYNVSIQSFKALPASPVGRQMLGADSDWPIAERSVPELAKVEPLLYARNYDGTPSQRETIEREIEGRWVLRRLGLAGAREQGLLFRKETRKNDLIDLR